jgi:uncharacterized paraquat-inducible protein A
MNDQEKLQRIAEWDRVYRQGKCPKCQIAFRWPPKVRQTSRAACPKCGEKLQATTHLLRWTWEFVSFVPDYYSDIDGIYLEREQVKK